MEELKKCSKCDTEKPISEFSLSLGKPRSYCKACARIMKAAWNAKNKDKVSEYNKQYHIDNREQRNKRQREYAKKNNIKSDKEYLKQYYQENKTEIRQKQAAYRRENIQKIREQQREYQKSNPNKFKASRHRRRAKKLELDESFTSNDIKLTFELFNNSCYNCGSTENLQIDHHYPLKMNTPLFHGNAVILCSKCNQSKGAKKPEDFYDQHKYDALTVYLSVIYSMLEEPIQTYSLEYISHSCSA